MGVERDGAVGIVAALLVWTSVSAWRARRAEAVSGPITSIVVLPFENLSGDPAQEYFADGMTEALTTDLAQIGALRVISRTSAMQYKDAKKPLSQIARELNIDAAVEGAVVRDGDRVRITAQLIHAGTDRHVWAQSYERQLRNVLSLQMEVAGAIAAAIQVEIRPDQGQRLARAQAVDPKAYDEYLRGRYYWSGRPQENVLRAVDHFQKAIELDPMYAAPYSGLSDSYRQFDQQGLGAPRESMPKAEAAARKALELDPTLAEAHASLAGVLYRYHWNWDEAEKEFRRTLELDPNYAEGYRAYAIYLLTLRRHDEAVTAARRARELSPLSPIINIELATALERAGRFDDAIELLQKMSAIDPNTPRVQQELVLTYLHKGDLSRAVDVAARAVSRGSRPGVWIGYVLAVGGRRPDALKMLAMFEERSQHQYISPQAFAVVHLGLGDTDRAFALLEKACDERAFEVLGFSGPLFDRLHDEPRFRELLRRMGLAGLAGYQSEGPRLPVPKTSR
jgi:TolB-like protein/Flp pilus assembly protein TadD